MFMRKLPRTRHIWRSEILVPYLNNPSEETLFGSNKIKEQHGPMNFKMRTLCSETLKNFD